MSKIEKFHNWAKQFIAIQDSHVQEILDSVGDMSLHEMKVLFSGQYQDRIAFSYYLQIEKKDYTKDLHIKKAYGISAASGNTCNYGHSDDNNFRYAQNIGSASGFVQDLGDNLGS